MNKLVLESQGAQIRKQMFPFLCSQFNIEQSKSFSRN